MAFEMKDRLQALKHGVGVSECTYWLAGLPAERPPWCDYVENSGALSGLLLAQGWCFLYGIHERAEEPGVCV